MLLTSRQTFPTLTEVIWQVGADSKVQKWVRYCLLAITGSALVGLCAQVTVPFFPVPITGQTFAVFLIGLTYGWKLGGATLLLYLAEGAVGFPVFSGGTGGLSALIRPGTGYLCGFVFAASACGWLAERGFDRSYIRIAFALLVGNILLYTPGLLWLGFFLGWDKPILAWGLYPFIFGDLAKMLLVVILLPTTWKFVKKFKLECPLEKK